MKNNKYAEISTIVQVLGCLYKKPKLFEQNDEYKFYEEDFYDNFHKIVFGSIYNLWMLGAKEITLPAIEDYLTQRPKALALFKTNKGEEFILKAAENANLNTFNYYYSRMKKMSLLRAYSKIGMDLNWIYDPDNILDTKKKQKQEDWLDNASLADIYNKINDKIDEIKEIYVEELRDGGSQLGEGIDELIDSFANTPAVGYPLYDLYTTTTARGARLGKFYLRSAATNVGKAIPNNTLIPTPDGWRKVGDIKEGDMLFGQNGKPTKVLKIHPQPTKKQIWNIEFADGRIAQCCGEHLWEYDYASHRGRAFRVEDTQTIYNRSLKLKNGFKDAQNKGYRFRIKLNKEVEYSKKEYSLPPYVMGAFLGDGSFRYDNTNKSLTFSSENEDIPNIILSYLGNNYYLEKYTNKNYSYCFKNKNNPKHPIWVEEFLKDYSELWNMKSEDKFIPQDYLLGSIEQRYDLLAGLLDTDGNIDKKSASISINTISSKLKDNIIELAHSLGMITSILEDKRDQYTTGICYKITLQCKNEIKPRLFKLKRKQDIAILHANKTQKYFKDMLPISNIYPTEEETDMTCFTVDNPNHLFLMNDYIVTHNTRAMLGDACYIGCSQMFDIEENKWVTTGANQSVLFIATEQDIDEIQVSAISFLSGVEEDHIVMHEYYSEEWERVEKAKILLKNSKIQFKCMPDFTMEDIETLIKKHIREHQVQYVMFDYIHSSARTLADIGGKSGVRNLREDNVLFLMASKLKEIAVQYGVFVLSSTQVNADYQYSETPDQNLLRGSKAIADRIDFGTIMLEVRKEDIEKIQPFCNQNGLPLPNVKMSIYKNRANRWKGIYLWMVANTGLCRFKTIFATDWNFNVIDMPLLKIKIEEESIF